ncbi:MAG: AraC family transcriptional regulator [Bifidobacteriaceae bacterium]|jgi:AraC-like DNA-binding protein|nr:AraC family transcriptional regulator [Bifidobacteriaceae bacterium]
MVDNGLVARRRALAPGAIDRRSLPILAPGEIAMPFTINPMSEAVQRDTFWAPHAHATHELLWNRRGASTATIGARTWTITPVIGLWVPAGVLHAGRAPAGTWYRTAHFDLRATAALPPEPVAVEVTALLGLLLDRLAEPELTERSRDLTEMLVFDLLKPSAQALLVHLPRRPLLAPILAAHQGDPADARTLADWARELGVSSRTVTRAFRVETGLGFADWQAAFRAQQAALLLGGGLAVDEVAELVGYRSASAFGVAFRRVTGMSPGRFRGGSSRPELEMSAAR